jgi:hypothetical protein
MGRPNAVRSTFVTTNGRGSGMKRSVGIVVAMAYLAVAVLNLLSLVEVFDINDRFLKSVTIVALGVGAAFLSMYQGRRSAG